MTADHIPVLLEEVIKGLELKPGDNVIDGTIGSGGHAQEILKAIAPDGKLMGFDKDPEAIKRTERLTKDYGDRLILINDSYSQLEIYVERYRINRLAGVLLDLGFSSTQLADRTRGFSFQTSGLLDLRYNQVAGLSAAELLNTARPEELQQVFIDGDEPTYRRLTKAIVEERRRHPFTTTDDLLKVVVAIKGYGHRSLHPATLVWQALRMAVNNELQELQQGLAAAARVLDKGGRLAVISFHSGEDRVVKNFLRQESRDCWCSPNLPECQCHHQRSLKIISKKVIKASAKELTANPRASSAKLRLASKII